LIDPRNAASLRVADKTGFRLATRTTYKDQPTLLYERFTRP
jgi:hypothetical protein